MGDYMLKHCPTSCGLCAPKCADLFTDCNHWANNNQCLENPGYMNLHCPVSCGICKGACKDTHNDCPGWAAGGECTSNPGHTLKHCPFSCGVCKAATSEGPKERQTYKLLYTMLTREEYHPEAHQEPPRYN